MQQLSVTDLAAWLADPARARPLLLDVREAWEVQTAALPGITHVPMNEIPARVDEIAAAAGDNAVVAVCHHGARSMQVALFLESRGVGSLHNLAGGMDAWSAQVDPGVPRY